MSSTLRLLVACIALTAAACRPAAPAAEAQTPSIRFLAEGDDQGFARAEEPRALTFPHDHGSHDEYRTEWWYFTGNLADPTQRHFGFELTFFRIALSPQAPQRESEWAANQIWMAHFALTDTAGRRFVAAERFARGALGLAGASLGPLRIWVEDWSVAELPSTAGTTMQLKARHGDDGVDLRLTAVKPPVPHGEGGLDTKGPEPGNASYYYSLPRLAVEGSVSTGEERFEVTGLAWMDREWGTSALSGGVAGWDWFSLQLTDGRDLMFYRLRRVDGSATPFSTGSLIDADGGRVNLEAHDVTLEVLRRWRSPASGVDYPVAWRLGIPSEDIELTVEPYLDEQELDLTVRYWEGAVRATGTARGEALAGSGYLELAGY